MKKREPQRIIGDVESSPGNILPIALRSGAAARYISVSHSTLKRLEAAGELPVIRVTRHKLYPIAGLNALVRKGMERLILKGRKNGREKQLGKFA